MNTTRWREPLITNFATIKINWKQPAWKIIFLPFIIIPILLLIPELRKESSNIWIVLVCCFFFSLFLFFIFRTFEWGKNIKLKRYWEIFPLVTIVALVVSIDNDVVTQSDGKFLDVLKRIYIKDAKVDISQEFNKHSKPNIVVVLDMSGSTQGKKIEKNSIFYLEADYWEEKLKSILTTAGVKYEDKETFLKNIKQKYNSKTLTEYDIYKLKLLDFISSVQKNYKISIVCFGKYPILSQTYANDSSNTLREIFYFISDYEKDTDNKQKTDFVKLFEKILEEYNCKDEKKDINKSPKYSYIFFSDYIHESIKSTSKKDLENIITKFSKSPYFNNFYYFEGKNYEKPDNTGKGLNIYPILKQLFKEENGRFSSLTENYTEVFSIFSNTIIPIYYEYALGDYKSKTIITFDSITHPFFCDISLEINLDNKRNHHHQFYFSKNVEEEKQLFPVENIKICSTDKLVFTFDGRVIDRFPCHSLSFYFKESNGYCKFDIVFFKDFSKYVRYIVTILIILIEFWLILLFRGITRFIRLREVRMRRANIALPVP